MANDYQPHHAPFKCWIQRADYSIRELGALTESAAIEEFKKIDIDAEGAFLEERAEANERWCEFGFGMNGPTGEFVHLFCVDSTSNLFEIKIERLVKKKLFGLIPVAKPQKRVLQNQTVEQCIEVISRAYRDFDALVLARAQ